jgi:hypothetical protein
MRADEQEPDTRPTVAGEEARDDEAHPCGNLYGALAPGDHIKDAEILGKSWRYC